MNEQHIASMYFVYHVYTYYLRQCAALNTQFS